MPWEWHKPLFDHARKLGITIFSSPFDTTAVDLLEELGAPAYKIASFEAIDLPLIAYAARHGKPLIISTGMANLAEIEAARDTALSAGAGGVILLHCVSSYPASFADANLRTIPDMAARFDCPIGLSDHTPGTARAVAARRAWMSALRTPPSSSSCAPSIVVPPGLQTMSLSSPGCLPVSSTIFAVPSIVCAANRVEMSRGKPAATPPSLSASMIMYPYAGPLPLSPVTALINLSFTS